jgi:hypothetical protein
MAMVDGLDRKTKRLFVSLYGWNLLVATPGMDVVNQPFNVEREFNPDRKDPHWGKRKLKRDQ